MPLDRNTYQAIELAVKATGQAGVDALNQSVQDLKAAIAAEQAQLAAGGAVTQKTIDDLAKLKAQLDQAKDAYASAERVMAGKAAAVGSSMRGASDAVLQLSRGLEDLATGGPIGILNNLPGIGRGIATAFGAAPPQIAAVESAIGFLGTGAFLLYQNFDRIKAAFGTGNAFGQLPNDVEGLTAKLKELESIKVKTLIDYRDIDIAQAKLDRLKEAEASYDRLKNKRSKAQQEASERATEAIVEYGGGDDYDSSVDKIAGLAARHTTVTQSARTSELAEQVRRTRAAAQNPANAMGAASLYAELADFEKQLKASRSNDQGEHLKTVRGMVGRAGSGFSNEIDWLLNIVRDHGNEAAQAGITEGFVQKLGGASRGRVERDASDKLTKAHDKANQAEVEKAAEESAQETAKRVREAIQAVKAGVDDGLEDALQDAMKGGDTREQAMAKVRAGLVETLKNRGVSGYDISEVADQLIGGAADRAENNIGEGTESKLDRQKATADAKKQREANQAQHKARTEAEQAQRKAEADKLRAQRQLEAEAKKSGFLPEIEARLAANRRGAQAGAPIAHSMQDVRNYQAIGQPFAVPEEAMRRQLATEVGRNLRASGGDPRHARGIVDVGAQNVDQMYQKDFAQLGGGLAAMQGVVNQTQGHVNQAQGQIASILNGVSQLQKKNAVLAQNAQRLNNQARRTQQQRPSLLTEGDTF